MKIQSSEIHSDIKFKTKNVIPQTNIMKLNAIDTQTLNKPLKFLQAKAYVCLVNVVFTRIIYVQKITLK